MARQQLYPVDEARRLLTGMANKYALTYSDSEWADGDLDFRFHPQSGLLFAVTLSFQNRDEFHLQTDDFCSSYFPCTDPEIRIQFEESVDGLFSGEWRILARKRSWGMLNSELQQPNGGGMWLGVRKYTRFGWPFGRVTTTITQNRVA